MTCFYPLKAYRSPIRTAAGKLGISFSAREGYQDLHIEFPCNKCIGCRVDRSREWAVRCMHEAQMHQANCFLTLTYDDKKLPADYSVSLEHYQKFLKRLRFSLGQEIRFFGCAEYGDLEQRPHYHFLIFNYRPTDLKLHTTKNNIPLYTSQKLTLLWKYGFSTVGELTYQTAAYCARYVIKKIGGDQAANHYLRIHPVTGKLCQVKPEFSTSSRRPGLGDSWLKKYKSDFFPSDFVVVDRKKHPVPKFYIKKLQEEEQQLIKRRRVALANKSKADTTSRRLRVRETVFSARISKLKRDLK